MYNYIILKSGILKAYNFNDDFIKEHEDLFNEFEKIWDELYSNNCCVWGVSETNKNNDTLKISLCDTLDKFFDLGVEISNGWDDEVYKNKNDYREYILNYGK